MFRITQLDHIVLNVADVDRALAFYAEGLGLPVERLDQFRRGEVKFPSVRITADTIVDLFPPAMHGEVAAAAPNLNHVCLVADNTPEEIRAQLEALGAPIEHGPTEVWGAHGIGVSYYTRDPDGNVVELRSYAG